MEHDVRVWVASLSLSLWRDGRASATERKGVGLGDGEGEDLPGIIDTRTPSNPSPWSSPLVQGERREAQRRLTCQQANAD
jgi:hypothetical protein